MAVRWINIDDPEALNAPLKTRGFDLGASQFARGGGIAWAIKPSGSSTYFACTHGGPVKGGQIWRYIPSPHEGTPQESEAPAS
ncbi:MAG: hypothetical protein AAF216_04780 [Pseudomonadota bacterium]